MRKLAVALSLSALSLAGLSACPNDKSPATSGSASPAASPGSAEEAQVSGAEDARIVSFQGRSIDLGPHIAGYPYRSFRPYHELGALLYMHEGDDGRTWWTLPLGDQPYAVPDLASGRRLNDIDWTTRSNRGGDPLPDENALLFLGDEDNREEYDLYKLFLEDGRVEKWTDVPYVYGAGVDDARDRVLYVARYPIPDSTEYRSCLEEKPLPDGEVRSIVCDDADLFGESTFTWTSVVPSPDGAWAYVRMNVASDRNRGNLWRIRLDDGGAAEQLTEDAKRTSVGALEEWLDDDRFVYIDDASGFSNVGVGSHASGDLGLVTDLSLDLKDVTLHPTDAGPRLLVAVGEPWETQLRLLDAEGTELDRHVTPDNLYDLTHDGDHAFFYATSRDTKMQILDVQVADTLTVRDWFGLPSELAETLDQCDVKRVQIPTFDVDPSTGETRLLHAYYAAPKDAPADGAERYAGVVAFYGGGNYWDTQAEILCQAGIATLSPAVRGSWGFGAEFYGLNDGDLGGDEIVDLQYAARWLVEEQGFSPRNIGVYGGSHGGYATMRALTFPPSTNDRGASFDWGWGVSFFGFSDIKTFWETCNIPDWVLLEAGDPATEPDKIADRSPISHVDLLEVPILLLHGENDQRVPVQESRQFVAACEEAGKDCRYAEFPGQGHGLRGIDNQVRVYAEWFRYLESLGAAP